MPGPAAVSSKRKEALTMNADSDSRPAGDASFAQRLWALAYEAFRRGSEWASDRRYAREHAALLDECERTGQLEVLMELTGATREQLRATELSPLAALGLFQRMMQRLGIDPQQAADHPVELNEAQWRCRLCREWRDCRHWLDSGAPDERYRAFCGNAELFERIGAALGGTAQVPRG
jgi:hypothetical protein